MLYRRDVSWNRRPCRSLTADFELLWGAGLGLWRLWSRPHCDAATLTLLPTRGEVDPSAVNSWINNTTGGFDKWGLIRQAPCQLSNRAKGKKEFERERQRDMGRQENNEIRHFWIGDWVRKIPVACPPFDLRKFTWSKYCQQSWVKLLLKVVHYNIALLHKKLFDYITVMRYPNTAYQQWNCIL